MQLALLLVLLMLISMIESKHVDPAAKAKLEADERQREIDAFELKKKDLMLRHQAHKDHKKKEILKKEELKQMGGYVISEEKEKKIEKNLKKLGIKSFDRR